MQPESEIGKPGGDGGDVASESGSYYSRSRSRGASRSRCGM